MANNAAKEAIIYYSAAAAMSVLGIAAVFGAALLNGPAWAYAAGYILVAAGVLVTLFAWFRFNVTRLTGYDRIEKINETKFKSLKRLFKG